MLSHVFCSLSISLMYCKGDYYHPKLLYGPLRVEVHVATVPRSYLFCSFAVKSAEQLGIEAFAVKKTLQCNIGDLRAVFGHSYPRHVIHIARAVVVPRGARGSYGDVVAPIDVVVVIVVQVPREERVGSVLEERVDGLEALRRIFPTWLMHE